MSTVQATNLKHGGSASNNIVLDASGNTTISGAATISGNAVVTGTLQANGVTGSVYPLVLGTAQASTSGTAIDFTGIPSWVRRVTVMFNGVSTNGSSIPIVQIGSGGAFQTSGYGASSGFGGVSAGGALTTNGFGLGSSTAGDIRFGCMTIALISGTTWIASYAGGFSSSANFAVGGGGVTLSGALDRVRITTVNGTDLFDAGSINLLWE